MMSVNRIGMNTCWAIRVEMMQFGSDNSYIQQAFIVLIKKKPEVTFCNSNVEGFVISDQNRK